MKNLIVFTDCGDTLVDESTQIFAEGSTRLVLKAGLFDGAAEELQELKSRGFRIALVADGLVQSFANIFAQHDLDKFFEARAISEEIGCEKPEAAMFTKAMERMGLTDADLPRIVMIGNNIARDIAGANRLGITSVLLTCSPRYPMMPQTEEEIPDYRVSSPREIVPLLEMLEQQFLHTGTAKPFYSMH